MIALTRNDEFNYLNQNIKHHFKVQWRIQDFPNGGRGAPTPELGPKTYYLARFLPKNA